MLCCTPITTGQLYQRAVTKGMIQKMACCSCLLLALFLFACELWQSTAGAYVQNLYFTEVTPSRLPRPHRPSGRLLLPLQPARTPL